MQLHSGIIIIIKLKFDSNTLIYCSWCSSLSSQLIGPC